ncbi:hypothetical protein W1080910_104 [Cyanophage S-RIM12 isolate W1_08_0910]|uniref:Uncharacterized protein n=3 Tax=Brizovirus TaxID=2733098 RepID=A0A1D7SZR6_9CAUD|nr:hypothetical protein HOQ65_gp132 [Cyanophage S-RIM12 isolate RW_06_0310]YP_009779513.1 hypothetical protein HOQ66_gp132 [Cyanophage S-RIM12 isolate W1_08_0910]AOO15377.1 hypothetical protein Np150310_103 [Cyanophage S-RIM12_Np_15_0310]AOO16017.1 hypothetical protein RW040310_103 [Cyanophage S-RIM12_RW_04_0310]AOO19237.1 hypothetical protein WH050310_103 [Cyanophage S-RIM12_WH_05_0310]AOO16446.1 hypothetical protein RW060310_104 [Cyanophage S-RIM12 isolate RW_06_0310]AOO18595.1 hypothetical
MNLLLRPLDYPSDPVWSVIILTFLAAALAFGYIVYIINIASKEMKDGTDDTPKQEELLQLPSDGD